MWQATVLTIFPEMFPGPLGMSLAGKAHANGIWQLTPIDIRNFANDRHRTVDDTPAGGGAGMVMKADVLARALDAVTWGGRPRLLMSPRGRPLTQSRVEALTREPGVVIVCGRFEGVDQRLIEARELEEVSIGDYVLSGGEVAAMVLIDACVRLLPGVMGKEVSGAEELFSAGPSGVSPLHPAADLRGPDRSRTILTSGDHAKIAAWRQAEAERLTRERRPDLWAAYLAGLQAAKKPKPDG